ncbi:nucleotidyltransferase family protein [bacterium]|nr:nucleotidyltransferase family protein [bacterium]
MLLEEVKLRMLPILVRHDVIRAAIFGSFARGESKENSDLDILVELPKTKSLLNLAALKLELEDELKRDVDILTYRGLHPRIREKVIKEQLAIL